MSSYTKSLCMLMQYSEYINSIIMSITNTFIAKYIFFPMYSIDLNKINYGLIQFKLKEINYDNIKGIVFDSFHSGSYGYRYMRIYNNKGQLIMNIGWLVETVGHDDNLIKLTNIIKNNCNAYINKTKPWSWLRDDVFYMHITDKNIYDEKEMFI